MKFNFSLQAVLDQRLAQEERMQRDYNQTMAQISAVRHRMKDVEDDIARWQVEVRGEQMRMGFGKRGLYENWIDVQNDELKQLQGQLDRMMQIAEKERQLLIKAMQARTLMEKLREREFKLFREDADRAEARMFDEFAVRDFAEQRKHKKEDEAENSAYLGERNS
ncbi:flagellar export protein FliJ [bacterium]|nr:flagellar export protein FliJ [bacterium]